MSLAQQLLIPHYGKVAISWWMTAGVTPIAAYQAKGAASYAISKINLVTPGTYDLTEGNGAVTWSGAAGWQFTAAALKYFISPLVPTNDQAYSAFVQFSNLAIGNTGWLVSARTSAADELGLRPNSGAASSWYKNGGIGVGTVIPGVSSTNMGIAGSQGYLNGAANGTPSPAYTGPQTAQINIARRSNASDYVTANILAVIIYNTPLVPSQAALIAAAMAAL